MYLIGVIFVVFFILGRFSRFFLGLIVLTLVLGFLLEAFARAASALHV